MDAFSLIAKVIGATARVGAVVALAAFVVYVGRFWGIEFFTALNPSMYQTIVIVGIVGACSVVVEFAIFCGKVLEVVLPIYVERLTANRTALKNVEVLTPEYANVLRYLKNSKFQRFLAPTHNTLLNNMEKACLIRTDDSNFSAYSSNTYYLVPRCVWMGIDKRLKDVPAPQSPPWNIGW